MIFLSCWISKFETNFTCVWLSFSTNRRCSKIYIGRCCKYCSGCSLRWMVIWKNLISAELNISRWPTISKIQDGIVEGIVIVKFNHLFHENKIFYTKAVSVKKCWTLIKPIHVFIDIWTNKNSKNWNCRSTPFPNRQNKTSSPGSFKEMRSLEPALEDRLESPGRNQQNVLYAWISACSLQRFLLTNLLFQWACF